MKKLFLTLSIFCIVSIKADDASANKNQAINEALENLQHRVSLMQAVQNFKTQKPLLIHCLKEGLAKGFAAGFGFDFIDNFEIIDRTSEEYAVAAGCFYSAATGHYFNKNHELADLEECIKLAEEGNELLAQQPDWDGLTRFQPEQFTIENEAYRAASFLTGFLAGAMIGSKLGTLASDGCMGLWDRLRPASFIAI